MTTLRLSKGRDSPNGKKQQCLNSWSLRPRYDTYWLYADSPEKSGLESLGVLIKLMCEYRHSFVFFRTPTLTVNNQSKFTHKVKFFFCESKN